MDKSVKVIYTGRKDCKPVYSSLEAAGADLKAAIENAVVIKPGERNLIPTGIKLEIPEGYEGQIRPRSGLAIKHGISALNSPGTIDSDYRGEICVILINHGSEDFVVNPGDRIAQLVIAPVIKAEFEYKNELKSSERGRGGFGSTGTADRNKD